MPTYSPNAFIPNPPPPPPPKNDEDWKEWAAALLLANHMQHEEVRRAITGIAEQLTKWQSERRVINWIATPFVAALIAGIVSWGLK